MSAALPKYIKFLTSDGLGPVSKFEWPIGEWVDVEGELKMCENGIHVCTIEQSLEWLNATCHPVEVRGEMLSGDDKICVRSARLGPALYTWNERTARHFAADCAEHVLHIYESKYPDDGAPRAAIAAARQYADGAIGVEELEATWEATGAAWEAAKAAWAAWDAAQDATRGVAWRAAWDAAWDARVAVGKKSIAKEIEWQVSRLRSVLMGEDEG